MKAVKPNRMTSTRSQIIVGPSWADGITARGEFPCACTAAERSLNRVSFRSAHSYTPEVRSQDPGQIALGRGGSRLPPREDTALFRVPALVLILSPTLRQSGEFFCKVKDAYNALGRPAGATKAGRGIGQTERALARDRRSVQSGGKSPAMTSSSRRSMRWGSLTLSPPIVTRLHVARSTREPFTRVGRGGPEESGPWPGGWPRSVRPSRT